MRLLIAIFVFISTLFMSTFGSLSSHAWAWSWKNLKIGITTEEELLKNGGTPWEVKLLYQDYLNLKQKKPYGISFKYYDSQERRDEVGGRKSNGGTVLYNPIDIPILTTAPLQLSDEITEIEFGALFIGNKLLSYSYAFKFGYLVDKIDTAKYIEMFNLLLGKPVSIRNVSWIEYGGCYVLEIFADSKSLRLQCIPGK